MMHRYKYTVTGPFVLKEIDNNDPKYLRLKFSDGHTRKLAKGGKWPPEYAVACLEKATLLHGQPVFITTSQTTKAWEPTEWLCNIEAAPIAEKRHELAQQIEPDRQSSATDSVDKYILVSCTSGKTFYANAEPIVNTFDTEDDFLDFSRSFEQGFVSAWTAKTARTTKLPDGVKRVRIGGLGMRTKRNGFRVVAAEVKTEDTSEAFKFFHLLRVDEKQEREDYLTDAEIKEIIASRAELESRYPKAAVSWMGV